MNKKELEEPGKANGLNVGSRVGAKEWLVNRGVGE
jgi:hypothetical protein